MKLGEVIAAGAGKLHPKDEVWKYKKYICRAKLLDLTAGGKIVVLNEAEAHENDLYASHRVVLSCRGKQEIAIIDLSHDLVSRGEIMLFSEVLSEFEVTEGDRIEIMHMQRPASIEYIKKKMDGGELSEKEMGTVMSELMQNRLSEAELAAFITSMYIRGMTQDEVVGLTNSVVSTGQTLQLGREPVCDKHCVGGVAGNRTTMVVVPIIAAAGLYIPKTSSRSITSAAGTADTMETLCSVSLPIDEMREIVQKSKGCVVWGGALRLASADDKLIKIRNPLSLDPQGVMLASILAKKKSVGAQYVVIDIPIGRGVKIANQAEAKKLADQFITIGKRLGMKIEVLVTDGSEPIGQGIGPSLECADVISVLNNTGPSDLREKSCRLAGEILEMAGKVKKGKGFDVASGIIDNGRAFAKFQEIVELQGGKAHVRLEDVPTAKHVHTVVAENDGRVYHIDNRMISKIARAAGAPNDKVAGVRLLCERGDKVRRGTPLFEIHSDSETKIDFAIKALEGWAGVELEKTVLSRID
jgi:AMP phosphorylase